MARSLLVLMFLLASGSAAAQSGEEVDVDKVGFRFAKMAIIAEGLYMEARRTNNPVLFDMATTYTGYVAGNFGLIRNRLNPEALEEAEGIVGVLQRLSEPGVNNSPAGVTAAAITSNVIESFIERIYTTGLQ